MTDASDNTQRSSKPNTYEVIGITHARYAGRDFYGEHASDMAELAWLRDWKRWGETEFLRLMRNHSVDIAAELTPGETPVGGQYCDRRRHNFVKLPGGIIATCTYCNRPEPPAAKARVGITPCYSSGHVCDERAKTGKCEHMDALNGEQTNG
jgi:hypothetical protein